MSENRSDRPMHLPRRARFVLSSSPVSCRPPTRPGRRPSCPGCRGGLLAAPLRAAAQTPRDWQLGMQAAHSPVQARIEGLHDLLLIIITVITVFVAGLLLYVAWRYRHDRHPTPSRVSHNPVLEVAWTIVPVLILVVIAIPSFRLRLLRGPHARGRPDDQGHRPSVVLGVRLSGPGQHRLQQLHRARTIS